MVSAASRIVFAVAWMGLQSALVVTASRRADAAFGFRMFAESSTVSAHLSREVEAPSGEGTTIEPVVNGEWVARGADGKPHRVRWKDRVTEPALATFDVTMHASYSAAAQTERWAAALDDVAAHLDSEDSETKRLHLDLVVHRNGREATTAHFTSAWR
jgi:hypothetical protein